MRRNGSTPSSGPGARRTTSTSTASFIKLKKVRAKPKPYGGTRPLIMNAGSSATGQAFALRNCDAFFTATSTSRRALEATAKLVDEVKSEARAIGREIEVFTVGQVICRPTQKEAEDYYHYAIIENGRLGRGRPHAGDQEHHAADRRRGGI